MDQGKNTDSIDVENTGWKERQGMVAGARRRLIFDELPWCLSGSGKALPPGIRFDVQMEHSNDTFRLHGKAVENSTFVVKMISTDLVFTQYALE